MRDKTLYLFAWPSQEDLARVLLHIPIGLIAGFSYFAHWVFPLVIIVSILFYEWNEDEDIADQAWKDVKGIIWGLGILAITLAILKLVGVLN